MSQNIQRSLRYRTSPTEATEEGCTVFVATFGGHIYELVELAAVTRQDIEQAARRAVVQKPVRKLVLK